MLLAAITGVQSSLNTRSTPSKVTYRAKSPLLRQLSARSEPSSGPYPPWKSPWQTSGKHRPTNALASARSKRAWPPRRSQTSTPCNPTAPPSWKRWPLGSTNSNTPASATPSGPTTPAAGYATPTTNAGATPNTDPFATNAKVLRVVASAHIPREAAETAVEELVLFAGLCRDDLHLRGPHLGVSHAVHFSGDDVSAATKAAKVLDAMRKPCGGFRSTKVADPQGFPIDVSLYADRSLADRARRAETKSTATLLEAAGFEGLSVRPRDGLIALGWFAIAAISCDPDLRRAVTTLNVENIVDAGFDPVTILSRLDSRARRRAPFGRRADGSRPPTRHSTPTHRTPAQPPPAHTLRAHPSEMPAPTHDGATFPGNPFRPTAQAQGDATGDSALPSSPSFGMAPPVPGNGPVRDDTQQPHADTQGQRDVEMNAAPDDPGATPRG